MIGIRNTALGDLLDPRIMGTLVPTSEDWARMMFPSMYGSTILPPRVFFSSAGVLDRRHPIWFGVGLCLIFKIKAD